VARRVRTPADFRDRMRRYGGALYGLSPAASPRDCLAHRTPLPGLFLAGQTTHPGFGANLTAVSGPFAAEVTSETLAS
jgi:phytoene desaturase